MKPEPNSKKVEPDPKINYFGSATMPTLAKNLGTVLLLCLRGGVADAGAAERSRGLGDLAGHGGDG